MIIEKKAVLDRVVEDKAVLIDEQDVEHIVDISLLPGEAKESDRLILQFAVIPDNCGHDDNHDSNPQDNYDNDSNTNSNNGDNYDNLILKNILADEETSNIAKTRIANKMELLRQRGRN